MSASTFNEARNIPNAIEGGKDRAPVVAEYGSSFEHYPDRKLSPPLRRRYYASVSPFFPFIKIVKIRFISNLIASALGSGLGENGDGNGKSKRP